MLEAANLPATLWGEAVLTCCYFWNCSESVSLPPGVTPYQVLNGRKPDLGHLHVFGARCFARIPTELQTKLGLHPITPSLSGIPKALRATVCTITRTAPSLWHVMSSLTRIFPVPHLDDSNSDDDAPAITTVPTTVPPSAVPGPVSSSPPPVSPAWPHRSACLHIPTAAGQAYMDEHCYVLRWSRLYKVMKCDVTCIECRSSCKD
ncbi:hypothetical protein EDB19DRAFT_1912038 [Suillus lakei]|nr:hypothetical protein EDB19DRAFT_1912038 [Suillus lakei]